MIVHEIKTTIIPQTDEGRKYAEDLVADFMSKDNFYEVRFNSESIYVVSKNAYNVREVKK